MQDERSVPVLTVYVAGHCPNCLYAYTVVKAVKQDFPYVDVRIVDLEDTGEAIPEAVFATPTYLLNGSVWSLGNPSPQQLRAALAPYAPPDATIA
jgi:hypothetical protein